MKFRDWVEKQSLNCSRWGKKVGINNNMIQSLKEGRPQSLAVAMKIVELTNSEVTFEDLLGENGKDWGKRKRQKAENKEAKADKTEIAKAEKAIN